MCLYVKVLFATRFAFNTMKGSVLLLHTRTEYLQLFNIN